ncbi:hypothetical protein [Poriferisphaera corsica]|nr:hypothetical protein [Poriferisphaera corsica]
MMAIHELGHAWGAWLSGGSEIDIIVPAVGFSRTTIGINPQPLFVAWMGASAGCAVPLVMAIGSTIVWKRVGIMIWPQRWTLGWAGFCLLANSAYIGLGWINHIGDAGDLLRHGACIWQLVIFGLVAMSSGFWIWHQMIENRRADSR